MMILALAFFGISRWIKSLVSGSEKKLLSASDSYKGEKLEKEIKDGKQISMWVWRVGYVFIGLALMFTAMSSIRIIEAGEGGVITRVGAITDREVKPGILLMIPFVESLHRYNVQVQVIEFTDLEAASTELQAINITGALNYRLNPEAIPWLFQNVGSQGDLERKFLIKSLTDSLKTELPDWPIETVLANRGPIANEVVLEMIRDSATFTNDEGEPVIFFTASQDGVAEIVCELEDVTIEVHNESEPDEDGNTTTIVELVTTETEVCGPEGEVLHLLNIGFSALFNDRIETRQAELINIQTARNVLETRRIEAEQAIAVANGIGRANEIVADSLEIRGELVLQAKAIEALAGSNVEIIFLPPDNNILPLLNLGQGSLGSSAPPPSP